MLARARIRPVIYPAAILVAFVLAFLVASGVSPYAAGRPLLVALLVGILLPWLLGFVTDDRDRAGLLALTLLLLLLGGSQPLVAVLVLAVIVMLLAEWVISRRRPTRIRWSMLTRAMTAAGIVLLLAVGIKAVQEGRLTQIADDLVAEAPAPFRSLPPPPAGAESLPDVTLILLDGYPRPDKLASVFGFDDSGFVDALEQRGFFVASHSRSNYPLTLMTLATMLNGAHLPEVFPGGPPSSWDWRHAIGEGTLLGDLRDAGYEIVSISSGFETVSLRRADRFIDTGQVNEFEWVLLQMTGLRPFLDQLLADNQRARITAEFDAARAVAAGDSTRPTFTLVHILSPHSPLVFGPDGQALDAGPSTAMNQDSNDAIRLGWTEYQKRLGGQITFLNEQTLRLIDSADSDAAVVVFSDHGSGARYDSLSPDQPQMDLRTANLLAVRTPGHDLPVDDRSTLVNVVSRLARSYAGEGPGDVPEEIHLYGADYRYYGAFERPD